MKPLYLQPLLTVNESFLRIYRGVEQLVARRAHNPKVVSSSLAPATKQKLPDLSGGFFVFGQL